MASERIKRHGDATLKTKPNSLKVGSKVLLRQRKVTKETSAFEPDPYVITAKNGSIVTAQNTKKTVTRNSSFFKKLIILGDEPATEDEELIEEESDTSSVIDNELNAHGKAIEDEQNIDHLDQPNSEDVDITEADTGFGETQAETSQRGLFGMTYNSEDGDEEDANNQNFTTPPDLHDRERPPDNAPRVLRNVPRVNYNLNRSYHKKDQ